MVKILFVCHGNICRSPMAELVLKEMVRKAGAEDRFEIASVATSCEELGNPVYPPAHRELQKHGIPVPNRRARQITRADLEHFDRIYYMDRFQPFLSRDVADPWYSGDFSQTWLDVCEGCEKILKEVL